MVSGDHSYSGLHPNPCPESKRIALAELERLRERVETPVEGASKPPAATELRDRFTPGRSTADAWCGL